MRHVSFRRRAFAAASAFLLAMGVGCGAAVAQIPSVGVDEFHAPPDARWAATTAKDVAAAYQLIRDNHPGMAPELRDAAFRKTVEVAHAEAVGRAARVTSYEGYAATLAGFANALGDKHIWSRPALVENIVRWPGIILTKRGDDWVVTDTDGARKALAGARMTSCDGQAVAELARKNLGGFQAVWRIGAQQIQAAPWLLVDEGNPFVTRPSACVFEQDGRRQDVVLDWQRVKRADLLPRLQKAIGGGAAGFGVRRVGDGYWISVQRLNDRAAEVVKAVQADQAQLRAAPFVVLDLRGNGGGSSLFGRDIATALFGAAQVEARLGPVSDDACGGGDGSWRASPDNIRNMEFLLRTLGQQNGPEFRKIIQALIVQAKAALAQGRALAGPTSCPASARQAKAPFAQPPGLSGRLILLTDNACFSSCLVVTDDFRHLGAYHVGQTTDAATRFTEVREQFLPSGYSLFSTLQAVDVAGPENEGPFAPDLPYAGDIADTAALEHWVVETALPKAGPAR